jgi:hypothetical protein
MIRIYRTIALGLFLLLPGIAAARIKERATDDSLHFENYSDKILIKLNVSSQTDQYTTRTSSGTGIRLRANNEYKVFLSLDYEFIGFSYGFSPRWFGANKDDDLKGHSSFTNYKFQFFPGQWLQTLSYDKTRGYYVENTGDFRQGWDKDKDPYLQLPNLTNVQWAMSTSYVFNPAFSFKNLIYQTQWQKKSAGSLVASLFLDYNRYSFDFEGTEVLQKDINARLGLGYYYTFIIAQHFYIAPSLAPSLGIRYSRYHTTEKGAASSGRNTYFTRFLEGGLKLGYNTRRWVAGGGFTFNVNWYNEDPGRVVEQDKFYGIVYLGFRFGTPRKITAAYKAISKILP